MIATIIGFISIVFFLYLNFVILFTSETKYNIANRELLQISALFLICAAICFK